MENKQRKREKRNGKQQAKLAYNLLVLFLFTAGCIVFEILTIRLVKEGFVERNAGWLMGLSISITAALLFVGVVFLLTGKEKLYKILLTVFFVLLFFLIVLFIVVKTDFILILQSPELKKKFL